jgi:hypothetical protein
MIVLPPLASPVNQLWHVLLDLSEALAVPWTLVGGQMVLLHALAYGQVPPEPSQDGDVVAIFAPITARSFRPSTSLKRSASGSGQTS